MEATFFFFTFHLTLEPFGTFITFSFFFPPSFLIFNVVVLNFGSAFAAFAGAAGITMATAIYSAVTGKKVAPDVAMTGEVTLRGRVLPIGGLREKTMAAYVEGIKTVVVPEANRSDLDKVDEKVKEKINFVFAKTGDDVLKVALV